MHVLFESRPSPHRHTPEISDRQTIYVVSVHGVGARGGKWRSNIYEPKKNLQNNLIMSLHKLKGAKEEQKKLPVSLSQKQQKKERRRSKEKLPTEQEICFLSSCFGGASVICRLKAIKDFESLSSSSCGGDGKKGPRRGEEDLNGNARQRFHEVGFVQKLSSSSWEILKNSPAGLGRPSKISNEATRRRFNKPRR